MKYDLSVSLTTPPAELEPPTEPPNKQLSIGDPIPRPPTRKHSSNNVPTLSTLSTPFNSLPTSPTEGSSSRSCSTSPVPAPTITARDDHPYDVPPTTPFRGSPGTPLCTIHEDKKLTTSARAWLMGKRSRGKHAESSSKDAKVSTKSEPPRKPQKPQPADEGPSEGRWHLPSAGVGEREVDGVMRVAPEIEAMQKGGPQIISKRDVEAAREQNRWRETRASRHRRGWEPEPVSEHPSSPVAPEELPEEANEYIPGGASPDVVAAAVRAVLMAADPDEPAEVTRAAVEKARRATTVAARAQTAALMAAMAEAEAAAAAEAEAIAAAAPKEEPKKLSAADRARAAVENEPHSPSWNGSTYVDGREHHYCGPDFPCQMESPCNPSIRTLWEKGIPVTPDTTPKRNPFSGPIRALFGIKQSEESKQKYRKPAFVESIRVGNTASTTFYEEPKPVSSKKKSQSSDRIDMAKAGGEDERVECNTMRRLRRFWGFWTYYGGKMGLRRGVIVSRSEESFVIERTIADREMDRVISEEAAADLAAHQAARNLAASACYPVGESNVEMAQVVNKADSSAQSTKGNEEARED